jgi:hypothetical protein
MDHEKRRPQTLPYQPESWRGEEEVRSGRQKNNYQSERCSWQGSAPLEQSPSLPEVREQTMLLELLGRVNYKIISGSRVYVEVGGVVYKTLYGGYWRSVFTGIERYLLRCEQVSGSIWAEESGDDATVDLPIVYSSDGWTASGHSLWLMLSQD